MTTVQQLFIDMREGMMTVASHHVYHGHQVDEYIRMDYGENAFSWLNGIVVGIQCTKSGEDVEKLTNKYKDDYKDSFPDGVELGVVIAEREK